MRIATNTCIGTYLSKGDGKTTLDICVGGSAPPSEISAVQVPPPGQMGCKPFEGRLVGYRSEKLVYDTSSSGK